MAAAGVRILGWDLRGHSRDRGRPLPVSINMDCNDTVTAEVCREDDIGDGE